MFLLKANNIMCDKLTINIDKTKMKIEIQILKQTHKETTKRIISY